MDEPEKQVSRAMASIEGITDCRVVRRSRLYRNPPMGPSDQPDFVNAAVSVDTRLDAAGLLAELQTIERRHGRVRTAERWGPRVIDLDLLVYGEQVIVQPDLTVPHPGIEDRAFVLVPLHEIEPELRIPGNVTVAELLARINADSVIAIARRPPL